MRALVTGGAGFIGSHLVDRLIADGHDVVILDNMSRGKRQNLRQALATGRCLLLDHFDLLHPRLPEIVSGYQIEVVYHLAAQIDVRASVADPVADARTNVLGTLALLEACRGSDVRKVLFASSVAIYGLVDTLPVTERTPVQPLSPYAASKVAAQTYLRQYHQLHGLASTTLVFANAYGPRQSPDGEAGVVAIFVDAMLRGQPTVIFGDGSNTRDYIYVGDMVDAFVRATEPAADGLRINIGTGVSTSDLELNRLVAQVTGYDREPDLLPPRLGDVAHMVVDPGVAMTLLDWRPSMSLVDGISETVTLSR